MLSEKLLGLTFLFVDEQAKLCFLVADLINLFILHGPLFLPFELIKLCHVPCKQFCRYSKECKVEKKFLEAEFVRDKLDSEVRISEVVSTRLLDAVALRKVTGLERVLVLVPIQREGEGVDGLVISSFY